MSRGYKDTSTADGYVITSGRVAKGLTIQDALTLEEIEASTPEMLGNKVAKAEAIKDVNNNLTDIYNSAFAYPMEENLVQSLKSASFNYKQNSWSAEYSLGTVANTGKYKLKLSFGCNPWYSLPVNVGLGVVEIKINDVLVDTFKIGGNVGLFFTVLDADRLVNLKAGDVIKARMYYGCSTDFTATNMFFIANLYKLN